MSKKSVLAACLVLVAGNAFAASTVTTSPAGPANLKGFNISKGVSVGYEPGSATAPALAATYAVSTKHLQGDKCYGGTSASSYVWFKSCTAGSVLGTGDGPTVPSSPSDSAVSNGFSQM
jgi:hypothetical protein